jgi:hypothetical protein
LTDINDLVRFLNNGTTLKVELPSFFPKSRSADVKGRVILQTKIDRHKATQFVLDIGSGASAGGDIVRLETKVITQTGGVPKMRSMPPFLDGLNRWLEVAHGFTSPFFKEFVAKTIMDKFKKTN